MGAAAAVLGRRWFMRRRLFNLAAAASLVLCLVLVVLWARSMFVADWVNYNRLATVDGQDARQDWYISSRCGVWSGMRANTTSDQPGMRQMFRQWASAYGWQRPTPQPFAVTRDEFASGLRRIGFTARSVGSGNTSLHTTQIEMPYWLTVLVVSVPLQLALFRCVRSRRTGRRIAHDQCVRCSYDLRATPERCPECGTVVVNRGLVRRDGVR